jgi:hypothetical protein
MRLPVVEIPVPGTGTTIKRLNNLTIGIQQFDLGLTEKIVVAFEKGHRHTMRIGESDYHVTGPVNVSYWPHRVQTGIVKLHCLKVFIRNGDSRTSYNIQSITDWQLTALDMEEVGEPRLEVSLERITQTNV